MADEPAPVSCVDAPTPPRQETERVTSPEVRFDPERLLEDLTPDQRRAVTTVSGPLAIVAGAGSGKTRVVSRRVAYAVATGHVDPRRVLVLTFTDRAAGEMVERIRVLRLPEVTARTFHSAALLQLRHFWPRLDASRAGVLGAADPGAAVLGAAGPGAAGSATPFPEILRSKIGLIARVQARQPGAAGRMLAKDVADVIEWAKVRRIDPEHLAEEAARTERDLPGDPADLGRTWTAYEAAKRREGAIDFEDMLELTLRVLETDPDAAAQVRGRYAWFSVDEYQDTNPLQEALLRAWLGDRDDLCVVGDPDQAIYSFTGATADFLLSFGRRHRGTRVVDLRENFRSTPAVIELANRLLAAVGRPRRLVAVREPAGAATVRRFDEAGDETAAVVASIGALHAGGLPFAKMAILVRLNAQVADWEEALHAAGVPFMVRGERFFHRADVRRALAILHDVPDDDRAAASADLADRLAGLWAEPFGFERGAAPSTAAARERQAALEALVAIGEQLVAARPDEASIDALLAEVARRRADEDVPVGSGVTLSTIHRAKGIEWEAAFLPGWEEGLLPYRSALGKPGEIAEERRLAYVGVTRARTHLWVSCAARRAGPGGKAGGRVASRFLTDLEGKPRERTSTSTAAPRARRERGGSAGRGAAPLPSDLGPADERLFQALRAWRLATAREKGVSPFIVAEDVLLQRIATLRPASLAALERVPGIGPKRSDMYGAAILAIVRADA
jgi:DNA helicase-2/ATP-dependent DNA helicase PcrA